MHVHTVTHKILYEKLIQNIILHKLRFSKIIIPISNKSHKHHKPPLERSAFSLVIL